MSLSRIDNRLEQRLSGAYIALEDLVSARFAAKNIKLQQRRNALSLLSGPKKTSFRGRGIDFEEVRAYQPGDDIRTIDWRVTARTGSAYTKLFREERERPVLIVSDQRQGMFFGSQTCFKSVTACYLSMLIAWSALQNNDRVGGLVHGNHGHREVRPRRNRQSVLALASHLHSFNRQLNRESGLSLSNEESLSQTLIEVRRVARPGNAVFLIGDFAGFNEQDHLKHLHQLTRHCEITALFVYDPLEQELPPPGQYMISDGRQKALIDTSGRQQRQLYTEHFNQRRQRLQQHFGRVGIPMMDVATTDAPLQTLLRYYNSASRKGAVIHRDATGHSSATGQRGAASTTPERVL